MQRKLYLIFQVTVHLFSDSFTLQSPPNIICQNVYVNCGTVTESNYASLVWKEQTSSGLGTSFFFFFHSITEVYFQGFKYSVVNNKAGVQLFP